MSCTNKAKNEFCTHVHMLTSILLTCTSGFPAVFFPFVLRGALRSDPVFPLVGKANPLFIFGRGFLFPFDSLSSMLMGRGTRTLLMGDTS